MKIDTRLPLAIDSEAVRDLPESHARDAVADCFSRIRSNIASMLDAHAKIAADRSLTEAGQIAERERVRARIVKQSTSLVSHAYATVRGAVAQAERAIDRAWEPKVPTALASEIRAHVKALPREERLSFISRATQRGDAETLHAILGGAPSYLSGLDHVGEEHWSTMREAARRACAPEASAELDALRKLEDRVATADRVFAKEYVQRGDPRAQEIERRIAERIAATRGDPAADREAAALDAIA